jgi:hypothetical protein
MRPIAVAIAAFFCALLCHPLRVACAQEPNEPPPIPSPLSLDAALQRMEERGFDLLAADAAVRSAEGAGTPSTTTPTSAYRAAALRHCGREASPIRVSSPTW